MVKGPPGGTPYSLSTASSVAGGTWPRLSLTPALLEPPPAREAGAGVSQCPQAGLGGEHIAPATLWRSLPGLTPPGYWAPTRTQVQAAQDTLGATDLALWGLLNE